MESLDEKVQKWYPVSHQLSARGPEETFNNLDQWESSFVAVRRVYLHRSAVHDTEVPGYWIHYRTRSSQFNSLWTGKTTRQSLAETDSYKYRVKRRVCTICQLYSLRLRRQSVDLFCLLGLKTLNDPHHFNDSPCICSNSFVLSNW